jgi:cytochrome b6-f complex iron-sulfur subunit
LQAGAASNHAAFFILKPAFLMLLPSSLHILIEALIISMRATNVIIWNEGNLLPGALVFIIIVSVKNKMVMNKQNLMSYNWREFLQTTLVTIGSISLAGTLAGFVQSCSKSSPTGPDTTGEPVTLDLSQPANQALQNVGGTLALGANTLDSQGILLIRAKADEVYAYTRRCTHQGCTIGAFSNGISTCPCHGSKYNTSGGVVNGPATASLKQYTTQLENNVLTISA